MRFVMFTYPDPAFAATWLEIDAAEREAEIERHGEWFKRHRDKIAGGEELAWPPIRVRAVLRGRGLEEPLRQIAINAGEEGSEQGRQSSTSGTAVPSVHRRPSARSIATDTAVDRMARRSSPSRARPCHP